MINMDYKLRKLIYSTRTRLPHFIDEKDLYHLRMWRIMETGLDLIIYNILRGHLLDEDEIDVIKFEFVENLKRFPDNDYEIEITTYFESFCDWLINTLVAWEHFYEASNLKNFMLELGMLGKKQD